MNVAETTLPTTVSHSGILDLIGCHPSGVRTALHKEVRTAPDNPSGVRTALHKEVRTAPDNPSGVRTALHKEVRTAPDNPSGVRTALHKEVRTAPDNPSGVRTALHKEVRTGPDNPSGVRTALHKEVIQPQWGQDCPHVAPQWKYACSMYSGLQIVWGREFTHVRKIQFKIPTNSVRMRGTCMSTWRASI